ncbi:hypothetical protein BpHYR1_042509 [Brachionus plicatilis]|uniref:Uncharacterized protein n=1 Tax=Brachionus plicatilis TaxID=10195 RepID=A0A3M7SXF8_BRAPC|nr:hypothetical protein BpHYR1_042509 [Brachionus plicatilis]
MINKIYLNSIGYRKIMVIFIKLRTGVELHFTAFESLIKTFLETRRSFLRNNIIKFFPNISYISYRKYEKFNSKLFANSLMQSIDQNFLDLRHHRETSFF